MYTFTTQVLIFNVSTANAVQVDMKTWGGEMQSIDQRTISSFDEIITTFFFKAYPESNVNSVSRYVTTPVERCLSNKHSTQVSESDIFYRSMSCHSVLYRFVNVTYTKNVADMLKRHDIGLLHCSKPD